MTRAMGEDQILALALEGRVHAAQGETAELVALAGNLALLPEPEIDPAFAAALEAQLLNDGVPVTGQPRLQVVKPAPAAPAAEPVKPNVVQLPRRKMVVRRSLVGVAVAASLAAFPLAMAANSLPGSPFYGLKTFMEHTWDARPGSAMAHAMRLLGRANEHMAEAQKLIANGAPRSLVDSTLGVARDEMSDAQHLMSLDKSNPVDVSKFSTFLQRSQARLEEIQQQLEGPAPVLTTVPAAAPRASAPKAAAPAPQSQQPTVASFAGSTRHSTKKTTDDVGKQTGQGEGLHQVEGCHPPLQSNLDPYSAGDTFSFMCRQGVGIANPSS
jgi:hypothetical protein